jgi:hypothetical protein
MGAMILLFVFGVLVGGFSLLLWLDWMDRR